MNISQRSWWIIGTIVAVVVIVGVVWIAFARRAGESHEFAKSRLDTGSTTPATSEGDTDVAGAEKEAPHADKITIKKDAVTGQLAGETVTVVDQKAGSSVAIEAVSVVKPTWVAIRDTDGRVLGAELINMSQDGASVTLLRDTVADGTYQAVMYVDDGDQQFDLRKDMLLTDNGGAPVASTFKAK